MRRAPSPPASAALVIIPLAATLGVLAIFAPDPADRIVPVWTGLMATVALAPRGEELMFPSPRSRSPSR